MKHDFAWAAGLFEGEGSMFLTHDWRYKTPRPHLALEMVDFDVVRKFRRVVGIGHFCIRKAKRGRKATLRWYTAHKSHVVYVLKKLLPYFGVRRKKKAKEILGYANYINRGWS